MVAAVDRDDPAGVRRLLRQGADPNAQVHPIDREPAWKQVWDMMQHRQSPRTQTGDELLWLAIAWYPQHDRTTPHLPVYSVDNVETVRALIDAGADVNLHMLPEDTRSIWKRWLDLLRHPSALHPPTQPIPHETVLLEAIHWCSIASGGTVASNPFSDNAETVQALLDAGANVNRPGEDLGGAYAYVGIHPLSVSATGALPLPAGGRWQTTPLIAAETLGKWRTVKELLARNANVNIPDGTGELPLAVAAIAARADIVEALIQAGANINASPPHRSTGLEHVVSIAPEASVEDCCKMMERYRIRRIPVVDANGACCGIVALDEIAYWESNQTTAALLRAVMHLPGSAAVAADTPRKGVSNDIVIVPSVCDTLLFRHLK